MSNHDKIFQARIDIETAAEISHATISEVMDNVDDDRYKSSCLEFCNSRRE